MDWTLWEVVLKTGTVFGGLCALRAMLTMWVPGEKLVVAGRRAGQGSPVGRAVSNIGTVVFAGLVAGAQEPWGVIVGFLLALVWACYSPSDFGGATDSP